MKKVLSQAIAAAAIFGAASAAQAVTVNHGGDGQALLFPYYSVEDGNYTALHLTNTTDQYKAVKVRFRRSADSADSLDFNLYLSPKDMWTGAVVLGDNGIPKLISNDTSCVSGQTEATMQAGIPFHSVVGQEAQKGHIEIIEMAHWTKTGAAKAVVAKDSKGKALVTVAQAVEHQEADADGVRRPGNCQAITDAWTAEQGYWATEYEASAKLATAPPQGMKVFRNDDMGKMPTGGLYGNAYVVNPDEAWASSFAPVALNELYKENHLHLNDHNHHAPRYALPDLQGKNGKNNDGISIESLVIGLGATQAQKDKLEELIVLQNRGMADFADIATALSKASIMSDFTVDGASDATTELVVTFPVKYAGLPNGDVEVAATFYDREENAFEMKPADWQTSPWLPGEDAPANYFVNEVNVVNLGDENSRADIGAHTVTLNNPTTEGWVNISFEDDVTFGEHCKAGVVGLSSRPGRPSKECSHGVENGVPVIGFTSTVLKNGTILGNGGINSYALNFPLKYTNVGAPK